jgi:hypothetical protein
VRSIGAYRDARLHLAALSLVAGAIHAVVAVPHFAEYWGFGSFFVALGVFQLGWGIQVYRRPSALLYRIGAWASLAVVALWVASRTVGLPLGPEPGAAEPVGPLDGLASAIEVAIAMLCASFLGRALPVPARAARATSYALMFGGLLALMLGAGHHG